MSICLDFSSHTSLLVGPVGCSFVYLSVSPSGLAISPYSFIYLRRVHWTLLLFVLLQQNPKTSYQNSLEFLEQFSSHYLIILFLLGNLFKATRVYPRSTGHRVCRDVPGPAQCWAELIKGIFTATSCLPSSQIIFKTLLTGTCTWISWYLFGYLFFNWSIDRLMDYIFCEEII